MNENDDLQQRVQKIIQEFSRLEDWESRYKAIIEMGRALPELADALKTEDAKVKGCQSQVWLHARIEQGRVVFQGDSDALLVRGLVALLLRVYSRATPAQILQTPTDFVQQMGLGEKLSPSRANGLFSMIKQIKYYALAYQTLA
jgi:cysteine desulfuration protein SufE